MISQQQSVSSFSSNLKLATERVRALQQRPPDGHVSVCSCIIQLAFFFSQQAVHILGRLFTTALQQPQNLSKTQHGFLVMFQRAEKKNLKNVSIPSNMKSPQCLLQMFIKTK